MQWKKKAKEAQARHEKAAKALKQIKETLIRKKKKKLSGQFKLVFCVRTDLKMNKGKIAAQCGHATVGSYEALLQGGRDDILDAWNESGQKKIALKVKSEEEMINLKNKAKKAGLITYMVIDAGHTQVAPNSRTVLAIGPGEENTINKITGHLRLL